MCVKTARERRGRPRVLVLLLLLLAVVIGDEELSAPAKTLEKEEEGGSG